MTTTEKHIPVLVTGGAGFIGSHTVLALAEAGFDPVIFDNFCNASRAIGPRLEKLGGRAFEIIEGDCRDEAAIIGALKQSGAKSVVHFAGLKAVKESVDQPIRYYDNNVGSMIALLKAADETGMDCLVFSSTATVYNGDGAALLTEDTPIGPNNPYSQSKAWSEHLMQEHCRTRPEFSAMSLRYSNPIGAHPSGDIGEAPSGIPNNLLPFISDVAVGKRDKLTVYGDDYPTPDGTCVRDYIHVEDLARGHVLAIEAAHKSKGFEAFNLSTGRGTSVFEMIKFYREASGQDVPFSVGPRRDGDKPFIVADPAKAEAVLGFKTELGIDRACADSWHWKAKNPNGYEAAE